MSGAGRQIFRYASQRHQLHYGDTRWDSNLSHTRIYYIRQREHHFRNRVQNVLPSLAPFWFLCMVRLVMGHRLGDTALAFLDRRGPCGQTDCAVRVLESLVLLQLSFMLLTCRKRRAEPQSYLHFARNPGHGIQALCGEYTSLAVKIAIQKSCHELRNVVGTS